MATTNKVPAPLTDTILPGQHYTATAEGGFIKKLVTEPGMLVHYADATCFLPYATIKEAVTALETALPTLIR